MERGVNYPIMLCKVLNKALLLVGIIFSWGFSNEDGQEFQKKSIPFSESAVIVENDLKILSWNIKMLPGPQGWFHNYVQRAEKIVQSLKIAEEYDIILFQEAFSGKTRKIIFEGLKTIYPHQIPPKDQTIFYKTNSGLWVISRTPISLIDDISFSQLRNWDTFSSKGAKLYSVTKYKQEFYFINTHMQSDYKTKYNAVRTSQYTEINESLILPNSKKGIPIILCGDLNISKPRILKIMLEKLHLLNGPISGELQFSTTGQYKEILDYILVKADKFKFKSIDRRIRDLSENMFEHPRLLSDHHAVEGIFKW